MNLRLFHVKNVIVVEVILTVEFILVVSSVFQTAAYSPMGCYMAAQHNFLSIRSMKIVAASPAKVSLLGKVGLPWLLLSKAWLGCNSEFGTAY